MTTLATVVESGAPPAAVVPASAGERLHALDSLRATAMLLGIVLHASVSLAMVPLAWPIRDVSASPGFLVLVAFIHGFRMQVFFLLAGFFAHLVWQRVGTRGFLMQRARRIGLPFIAGMLILVPIMGLLWVWADLRTGSTWSSDHRREGLLGYPTGHLWFLEMLLILYLVAVALLPLGKRAGVASRLPRIDAVFDWLMRQPLKPLLLAVPTIALLWQGPHIPEIDRAGVRLLPSVAAVGYYGLFFAVGWWLHRRIHLVDAMRDFLASYFAAALIAFVVLGASMKTAASPDAAQNWTLLKLSALTASAVFAWCMTFAVTGLFLRFAGGHRPWVRYVADASYWWYLWHLPIVILLQISVADWPLNGWLKLLMILGFTLAILLPSYHTMVRYTFIGRIMNGPRERAR